MIESVELAPVRGTVITPAAGVGPLARRVPEILDALAAMGLSLDEPTPLEPATDPYTAGSPAERARALRLALARPDVSCLWAARGRYGSTMLVRYLEAETVVVAGRKVLVGMSDVSFLGVYLASRARGLTYVHGTNLLDPVLFLSRPDDLLRLVALARGDAVEPLVDTVPAWMPRSGARPDPTTGVVVPMNLSVAVSLACLNGDTVPRGAVLFVEEVGEPFHRILRMFDDVANAGWFDRIGGVVLGSLTDCVDDRGRAVTGEQIAPEVAARAGVPVAVFPRFGHGPGRLPLVYGAPVELVWGRGEARIELSFAGEATS
jgi:muramoyltetrapeptide carboxypeptidase